MSGVRADVWDAFGGRCFHCGVALHPFRTFQIDHLTSIADGGRDVIENYVASCQSCNGAKGRRSIYDPRVRIAFNEGSLGVVKRTRYWLRCYATRRIHAGSGFLDALVEEWSRNPYLPTMGYIYDNEQHIPVWDWRESLGFRPMGPGCWECITPEAWESISELVATEAWEALHDGL